MASCFSEGTLIKVASKSKVNASGCHARRSRLYLAAARAVVIRFLMSASMASRSRHAVGCDATGPNSAGWSRNGAKSEEYPPPSAAITARSTNTRPGSCRRCRRTNGDNATDKSSCNPHSSATSASRRVPE